jgi:hypothetical protein
LNEAQLSLIVALVSVLTVGVHFAWDVLASHGAIVRYTAISCRQDGIAVLAANLGDRIAAVRGATFRQFVDGSVASSTELYIEDSKYPVLVPNDARELRLAAREDMLLPVRSEGMKECEYEVTLELAALGDDEAPGLTPRRCPCPR